MGRGAGKFGSELGGGALAGAFAGGTVPQDRGRLTVPAALRRVGERRALADWDALVAAVRGKTRATEFGIALGLDVRKPAPSARAALADPASLADTLGRADGVAAFHFCTAAAQAPAEWSWPLDVGLLEHPGTQALYDALRRMKWRQFVNPVPADTATAPIELLAFPATLADALRAVRAHAGLPRVQLAIVLGGMGTSAPLADAEELRTVARADAVCVVDTPAGSRHPLLDAFLVGLSHDLDADVAFSQACLKVVGTPPLMVSCDGGFERARIARWAMTLASRMMRMPPGVMVAMNGGGPRAAPELGAEMGRAIDRAGWTSETHGAKQVSHAGRGTRAEPPDPSARVRRVVAKLTDRAGQAIERGPIAPGRYRLEVWIGQVEAGAVGAGPAFPASQLPPSERGHDLTVVLTAHGILAKPVARRLHLPPAGRSERLQFSLPVPAAAERLEARITVLHENRIVQTLLLRAGVGAGAPSKLRLVEPEATFRRDLDGIGGRRRFDGALLFNDQAGAKLMTTFRDDAVSTVDLAGVGTVLADIATILEDATNRPDPHGTPDKKVTSDLLAELARNGFLLRRRLFQSPTLRDSLVRAKRVQIVAATPEGVLPMEMCYDVDPPDDGARVCKGWKDALKTGVCARSCPKDKRTVVCPVAFWATSKVIERYAYDKDKARLVGAHDFALIGEEAGTSRRRLPVLRGALCAAAKQARDAGSAPVDRAFARAVEVAGAGREVKDWKAWESAIKKPNRAAMQVLLIHTDVKETSRTLVIGDGAFRRLTQIDDRIVGKSGSGDGALVLLLGCSTAVTDNPLHSFVVQFWEAGSKIVIGTLCKVLGRHAGPIAEALVAAIGQAGKARNPSSLGDLMPRVRRSLLASGFPIVLSVAAFGDADWQI